MDYPFLSCPGVVGLQTNSSIPHSMSEEDDLEEVSTSKDEAQNDEPVDDETPTKVPDGLTKTQRDNFIKAEKLRVEELQKEKAKKKLEDEAKAKAKAVHDAKEAVRIEKEEAARLAKESLLDQKKSKEKVRRTASLPS
jgi:hypothetical protein